MTVSMIRDILLWCSVINIAILLWWFLLFTFARNWIYKLHGKWFKIPEDKFDAIHYSAMAFFKILIFVFNLVPYIAMCIVR